MNCSEILWLFRTDHCACSRQPVSPEVALQLRLVPCPGNEQRLVAISIRVDDSGMSAPIYPSHRDGISGPIEGDEERVARRAP
jgi:hypothetical protein